MSEERKIALVTGGTRGIGLCCAKELAKAGCDIIINGICDEEQAAAPVNEIKELGANAYYCRFDVSKPDEVAENINKIIEKHSKIDVLINNAGITRDGLFVRMTPEQWEQVININLSSAFYVTNNVIKHMMKARSGSIVSMASVVGMYGNAGQANYAASKAGLIALTKTLAKEFGSRNIRVNAVAPGFIKTSMTEGLESEKILPFISLKRLGEVEDVAKTVKFLALDANYITGQVIQIDGGLII